jgi:hypothetical protein
VGAWIETNEQTLRCCDDVVTVLRPAQNESMEPGRLLTGDMRVGTLRGVILGVGVEEEVLLCGERVSGH